MTIEKIIFGTGCFWGVEATFHSVLGVVNVKCGYAHGHIAILITMMFAQIR
ncbi:peptide-methionine (S)-S-oxide reductase [Nitrosomonas communis]|uniref:peptide-methionine (S)-S-oxide reductase n=1 Tax=Nitrosomonas communis TaxID=44574 RepID=UPI0009F59527